MITPELEQILMDPEEFLGRLKILNQNNQIAYLFPFWYEQFEWLKALCSGKRYVLGLKPRQVGFTTITCAFLFWLLYTARDPLMCLQMIHDEDAMTRIAEMIRVFALTLPMELRPGLVINNAKRTRFGHNGAHFLRLLAGGRGQGRSWTANHLHATEMAKWPQGSAANRNDESGGPADEEVFASVMATMHDERRRIIIESTGNGPKGLFYKLYEQAKVDPEWAFVFVPWHRVPRYQAPVIDSKALESDLDDEEVRIRKDFDLTLEQLMWRRNKIRSERWSPIRFRREYPLTDLEPFLLAESGWFKQDRLVAMLRWATMRNQLGAPENPEQVFKAYESHRRYGFALDPAGGTGGDEASLNGMREDALQVYTWNSNKASPYEQAQHVARVSGMYGNPPVLVEANHMGSVVIREIQRIGTVQLWTTPEGKFFTSTGGTAGHSKRDVMAHARDVLDSGHTIWNDPEAIRQAQKIVEKPNGKIEGSGSSHDDRAYGNCLALWTIRKYRHESATLETERERLRNIERQMRRFEHGS